MSFRSRKTILFGIAFIVLIALLLRVSHLDGYLYHKVTTKESHPRFPELDELADVQGWLELKNENPREAFDQLEMLFDDKRFEELSTVVRFVDEDTRDKVIAKYFTVSSGEISLLPHPSMGWLAAQDLWNFVQRRGIGLSRNEPDGQLFYVYGASLFRKGQSQKFLSYVENESPILAQNLLEVLHFAVITAPENTAFEKAYQNSIAVVDIDIIYSYLNKIAKIQNSQKNIAATINMLPEKSRTELKKRLRRETGCFLMYFAIE